MERIFRSIYEDCVDMCADQFGGSCPRICGRVASLASARERGKLVFVPVPARPMQLLDAEEEHTRDQVPPTSPGKMQRRPSAATGPVSFSTLDMSMIATESPTQARADDMLTGSLGGAFHAWQHKTAASQDKSTAAMSAPGKSRSNATNARRDSIHQVGQHAVSPSLRGYLVEEFHPLTNNTSSSPHKRSSANAWELAE